MHAQGLLRARGARTPLPMFAAAGMAGAASSAVLYPLEVVRSRITCDTVRRSIFLPPKDLSCLPPMAASRSLNRNHVVIYSACLRQQL